MALIPSPFYTDKYIEIADNNNLKGVFMYRYNELKSNLIVFSDRILLKKIQDLEFNSVSFYYID